MSGYAMCPACKKSTLKIEAGCVDCVNEKLYLWSL